VPPRSWILAGLISLVVTGLIGVALHRPRAGRVAAAEPNALLIPLDVSQKDGCWRLDWDHAAPPVQTASYGMLSIRDGARTTKVRLSAVELRDGNVVYVGLSAPVRFDLLVYGARDFEVTPKPSAAETRGAWQETPPPRKTHTVLQKRGRQFRRPRAAQGFETP
jgi:hypothetical protein